MASGCSSTSSQRFWGGVAAGLGGMQKSSEETAAQARYMQSHPPQPLKLDNGSTTTFYDSNGNVIGTAETH